MGYTRIGFLQWDNVICGTQSQWNYVDIFWLHWSQEPGWQLNKWYIASFGQKGMTDNMTHVPLPTNKAWTKGNDCTFKNIIDIYLDIFLLPWSQDPSNYHCGSCWSCKIKLAGHWSNTMSLALFMLFNRGLPYIIFHHNGTELCYARSPSSVYHIGMMCTTSAGNWLSSWVAMLRYTSHTQ